MRVGSYICILRSGVVVIVKKFDYLKNSVGVGQHFTLPGDNDSVADPQRYSLRNVPVAPEQISQACFYLFIFLIFSSKAIKNIICLVISHCCIP